MFAYCNNTPVNCYDNSGKQPVRNTMLMINDGGDQRRDVTDEVTTVLMSAAARGKQVNEAVESSRGFSLSYLSNLADKYSEFYDLVNHNAPWDIKREQPWETTIGTEYPNFGEEILFHNHIMTVESLGNFTYGYLGHEYGIDSLILLVGSYYAADFPLVAPGIVNEVNDWTYIIMGYHYAENGYISGGR